MGRLPAGMIVRVCMRMALRLSIPIHLVHSMCWSTLPWSAHQRASAIDTIVPAPHPPTPWPPRPSTHPRREDQRATLTAAEASAEAARSRLALLEDQLSALRSASAEEAAATATRHQAQIAELAAAARESGEAAEAAKRCVLGCGGGGG
jgi:hypothetical protein